MQAITFSLFAGKNWATRTPTARHNRARKQPAHQNKGSAMAEEPNSQEGGSVDCVIFLKYGDTTKKGTLANTQAAPPAI